MLLISLSRSSSFQLISRGKPEKTSQTQNIRRRREGSTVGCLPGGTLSIVMTRPIGRPETNEPSHLVLDFDGTLFARQPKSFSLNPTARKLRHLGLLGLTLCIASGRGNAALRYAHFLARDISIRCYVIRWNGLDGLEIPSERVAFRLPPFSPEQLSTIESFLRHVGIKPETLKPEIVRVRHRSERSPRQLVRKIRYGLTKRVPGVVCTWNKNVIDVSPPGCDKATGVQKLFPKVQPTKILAIGDSCCEFGNDFSLLESFPSFCVGFWDRNDRCAGRPVIHPSGRILRGTAATYFILRGIESDMESSGR